MGINFNALFNEYNSAIDFISNLQVPLSQEDKTQLEKIDLEDEVSFSHYDNIHNLLTLCFTDDEQNYFYNNVKPIILSDLYENDNHSSEVLSKIKNNIEYNNSLLREMIDRLAPIEFSYHNIKILNPTRKSSEYCLKILEGVDYIISLFKKRGVSKLLLETVSSISIKHIPNGISGEYYTGSKAIVLSPTIIKIKSGFIKWVNHVLVHEIGHHLHLNLLSKEAREYWNSNWTDINLVKSRYSTLYKPISGDDIQYFLQTLRRNDFKIKYSLGDFGPSFKVLFKVWLKQSGMIRYDDSEVLEDNYELTSKAAGLKPIMNKNEWISDIKLIFGDKYDDEQIEKMYTDEYKEYLEDMGLIGSKSFRVPPDVINAVTKSNDMITELEPVSGYARTNEDEDFAETFVAFMSAPEKLTPKSKFRMQRALSLSGLYGKPIMDIARKSMNIKKLSKLATQFYKLAISKEVTNLINPKTKNRYKGSDLWFTQDMANANNDIKRFAIFDRQNMQQIKDSGITDGDIEDICQYYLSIPQVKEFIDFVLDSYDKHFPNLFAHNVYDYLKENGELEVSPNPTFLIMHDLIHQVIQEDFVNSLQDQTQISEDGNEITVLTDQIYEDLASTFSNFQPSGGKFSGSFLSRYVKYICNKFIQLHPIIGNDDDGEEFKKIIDKTISHCKKELRNKIDQSSSELGKDFLDKYNSTQKANNKVKQMVDGTLSKFRQEMIDQMFDIQRRGVQPNANDFKFYDADEEYRKKLINADVIDQSEGVAVRNWLTGCFAKMQVVSNYFQTTFHDEVNGMDEFDEDGE